MPPSSAAATTSVQVALRIRPTTPQDATSIPARFQRTVIHAISNQAVSVDPTPSTQSSGSLVPGSPAPAAASASPAKKQIFAFDQVISPETSQHEVFVSTAEPLISRFLEGFNCTVLAYGQTSSGKTFSMTGIDLDADPTDPHNGLGIIPRSIATIFNRANALKDERGGSWTYNIKGSFVELYNEDLIDLLSMEDGGGGGRREVQIREDKHGHIIWDGLREVAVKSTNEVMSLIRQGTSIRRTNETDMNAQSSRSHAIFSLTLTQKKFTGSGAPPRSSTPVQAGRSPSRLARPASAMYSSGGARVSSPTFGRPPTPSFASAMGRGGGLRPSSALGMHNEGKKSMDDDSGEWVTIVSKFHFVDLAGSERLKRTAAVGERVKEGISINSGLLALGNVISALGDPSRAKSHTASHIPYRDSKLTRLLQDSLGGNAHTLMIACVSPAEWNTGETVNTLKYANRARNIKNRAVVTEKEEGWDDLEWLQNMVTRLRKEVKAIKEGGLIPAARGTEEPAEVEGASKKVLAQMVELQSNYEDLRGKFVERTEELTRLRRELGESHRHSAGSISGTAKYEEIVGPVIEEYEKTISAMEAELSLNRAALRHTNDLVEEKDEELAQLSERHNATELYVEELKSRVGKLSEREASTEAYIRDLEEKIKLHEDSSMSSTESVVDLRREIARHKEAEDRNAHYISELETRLGKSDESILSLRETVETLEREAESRREEVEVLQARLTNVLTDGEAWRSDLEDRESRVRELEAKMEEWEVKRQAVDQERSRLVEINHEVQRARKELESDITVANVESSAAVKVEIPEGSLQMQLDSLRETHAATLSDLNSITAKYRDALKEISDLAEQINEIKLGSPSDRSDSPERFPDVPQTPRRRNGGRSRQNSDVQLNGNGRRLFFRHAASVESLQSRSLSQSQSLSQELSSARSRMLSSPDLNLVNGTNGRLGHSPSTSRTNLSISLPYGPHSERSVASLEKEIMRLQEVLKDRESEIRVLETTLKDKDGESPSPEKHMPNGHAASHPTLSPQIMEQFSAIRRSMEIRHPPTELTTVDDEEPLDRLNELMLSMAQKEARHRDIVDELNEQLESIRGERNGRISREELPSDPSEASALRQAAELETLKRNEVQLLNERADLQTKFESECDVLKRQHEDSLREKQKEVDMLLQQLSDEHELKVSDLHLQLAEAAGALAVSQRDHEEAFGRLKEEHEEELQKQKAEVTSALVKAKEDLDATVSRLKTDHDSAVKLKEEEHSRVLQRTEEEYYAALSRLRSDHAELMAKKEADFHGTLERLREELAGELKMAELVREGSLTESQSHQATLVNRLQSEHASAIEKKEVQLADDLRKAQGEHVAMLTKKQEDHSIAIERLKAKHSSKLVELEESKDREIDALRQSLDSAVRAHDETMAMLRQEADERVQKVRDDHASHLAELKKQSAADIQSLEVEHEAALRTANSTARESFENALQEKTKELLKVKAEQQAILSELESANIAAIEQHREDMENARLRSNALIAEERKCTSERIQNMEAKEKETMATLWKDNDVLREEVASYKAAEEEYLLSQENARQAHETDLQKRDEVIFELRQSLKSGQNEKSNLLQQLQQLRSELEQSRLAQSRLADDVADKSNIQDELTRHRTLLVDVQSDLQKTKENRDALLAERTKQESIVRDLQVQLSRAINVPDAHPIPTRPSERSASFSRSNGMSKLPPLTPPPSVPPPPAPRSLPPVPMDVAPSISSQASTLRSSGSSKESNPDSPSTSLAASVAIPPSPIDPRLAAQVEDQGRQIEEQEVMIKTLNKQLSHCESDLQAHMDLVSTLETSLGDSEKNLRKARMQATEIARERDTLNSQIDRLRSEVEESRRELATVRRSVVEEKQSLESRLDEERRAKERVRQQLDMRVDELQKRKSKFVCL